MLYQLSYSRETGPNLRTTGVWSQGVVIRRSPARALPG